MIFGLKTRAPVVDVMVTLCVFAASLFRKAILNGRPAETLRAVGRNIVSFASSARVSNAGVARGVGVGFGVGFGPGVGVGFGFGVARGVGVTAGVDAGLGERRALGEALAVATVDADAADVSVADGTVLGVTEADGATDPGSGEMIWLDATACDAGAVGTGAGPPQAAASRPTATIRRARARGIRGIVASPP
jgi:hypothetical protein